MSGQKESVPWCDSEWTHRRKISINHKMLAADLKNYKVLFNASPEDVAEAVKNGDVFVTAEDGTTKLNCWPDGDCKEWLWIEVPELSTTGDTSFFIYYKER